LFLPGIGHVQDFQYFGRAPISPLKQRGLPGDEFLLKSSRACPFDALDALDGLATA
jgi:hypothetical protein